MILLLIQFTMAQPRQKLQLRLQALIGAAQHLNIEVRTEKLLREVGYRPRSGRCRVNGQDVILLDRDAPMSEQIEFLASELSSKNPENR